MMIHQLNNPRPAEDSGPHLPRPHSLPRMVMARTAVHLIPHQGGVTHLVAVVEPPMGGVRHKGVIREDGVRRCLMQEDGQCRPASGSLSLVASWFRQFIFLFAPSFW
jgi:hypothetical protein